MGIKTAGQEMLNEMDEMLKQKSRKRGQHTYDETQNQDEMILGYMLFTPDNKTVKQTSLLYILFHHSRITVTVPFDVNLIMLEDFAEPFSSCLYFTT